MGDKSILFQILVDLPWPEMTAEILQYLRKLVKGLSHEGMYEVLDYESTLELLDREGKKANFKKQKSVKYLQDNIIAYQDHAWGDGDILLNYSCSPGKAVDRYRLGYKTYLLISLHEVKNRGDEDEFNIEWDIKNGFLVPDGFWDTDIAERTRRVRSNIIFPKGRSPKAITLHEVNQRKVTKLSPLNRRILKTGQTKIFWEIEKPRLYEHYLIRWEW